MTDNFFDIAAANFPVDADTPFIELESGRRYSYRDLKEISGRYARLLTELGVVKGDRVAVQVEKSAEAVFLYLACLRAGAAYLPLNTAYTKAEVGYFLGDAEPVVFVCTPGNAAALADTAKTAGVGTLLTLGSDGDGSLPERAAGLDPAFDTVACAADDLAAILYTSGTTGRSKGAMLSHRNLSSNAATLHRIWGFRPDDVLLHALPIFHTHGLFVATNCVLMNGSGMLFLPKFDADAVFRLLPRATVMMGVPTFYTRLLADPRLTREAAAHMRLFISGSAPLLADTHREFAERTGHAILERYGMTETGMLTSNPLDGDRIPGTVGFPLPEVSVRVANEKTGEPVPDGEIGVLEVKGPNVFSGYWRMPEKTAQEIRPGGWFITGDVGRIDGRGYVHIIGRAKDLVISGGFNVYPKEVETVIDAIPGVVESAVIGVPHPDFGEAVMAVVLRRSGGAGEGVDEAAVVAACKEQLANFKVPKAVVFVDELPRNAMGKVQKALLRETYKGRFAG
ncbi:malonyl-CoA/methylmalonyl-CoA synthetase [Azospirillum lipoferum]|uniref:3-methylmercaptopropionyl-CoA ligase n=1 Tax=Azospirillum lipoferum TaxID=193 RepID=A0A5A9G338_AZOLI|nr:MULTISPECIES: malonyl-CoA synthase [Azospirillum]KAA0588938.1 malonyl-CoA synthase [Azospirillum lipoferum]MCP1615183.1 malonyl-CoA/methylmalonyl-CoA synthetase [Azospirillum lipoferum]MDW5537024.1 malonyl-CoA synthase [Azospirillum sp. NL1]